MQDELWMRHWVGSHDRLSADLDRGLKWLRRAFQRYVETVVPSHAPGEDVQFVDSARRALSAACAGASIQRRKRETR